VTGWQITSAVVAFWLLACTVGVVLHLLLAHSTYQRGVLDGQRQAELAHSWHPPVNGAPTPTPRRRSPDEQFVTRPVPAPPSILGEQSR
jgi:hypothetical protein